MQKLTIQELQRDQARKTFDALQRLGKKLPGFHYASDSLKTDKDGLLYRDTTAPKAPPGADSK